MADNLRKYTTQEVLNKVYTDSSGDTIGLQAQTSKETLNAVLNTSTNSLNVSLSGSNTISGDVTITGDLTVQGNGTGTYDEIVEGNLQVGNSSTADSTIVIESSSSGDPKLQFTSTSNRIGIMDFVEGSTLQGSIVYDHNGDNLKFATGSTNRTARFTVNETSSHFTSKLGIGIASPVMALDIKGEFEAAASSGSDTNGIARFGQVSGTGALDIGFHDDSGGYSWLQSRSSANYATMYNIVLQPNGGNVGIGTSSVESLLHIQSDTTAQIQLHNTSSGNAPKLLFDGLVGTNADYVLGSLRASWDTHTNIVSEIRFESGSDTTNKDDGVITFWTSPSSSTVVERMRINQDGNVGIGISPETSQKLQVKVASNVNFTTSANSSSLRLNAVNDAVTATIPLEINSTSTQFLSGNTTFAGNQVIYADGNITIPATKALFFDGGTHTYISETSGDILKVYVANAICGTFRDSGFAIEPTSKLWFDGAGDTYIHEQSADKLDFVVGNGTRFVLDTNSRISLSNNDAGSGNTIFGELAGNSIQSGGNNNVIIGDDAGLDLTTADENVLVGKSAGANLTTSDDNVAIGASALATEVDGTRNVAVGYQSLTAQDGSSVIGNTAVGYGSAKALTTGSYTVSLGYLSMGTGVTTGDYNIAIGHASGYDLTSGNNNVLIGKDSGENLTSGIGNVFIGQETGKGLVGSHNNIIIGREAGKNATSTIQTNVIIGYGAGNGALEGGADGMIAVGASALGALTTGANCIAIGKNSMSANTTGQDNISIGFDSAKNLNHANSVRNTVIGHYAGDGMGTLDGNADNIIIGHVAGSGTWATASSKKNIAIGNYALNAACNGALENVAIGYQALTDLTEGDSNVAVGMQALQNVTTGVQNVAVGSGAGNDINVAGECVAIGFNSGSAITDHGRSVFVGHNAGANQEGETNVFIGKDAGLGVSGSNNDGTVAIGFDSLKALTTGVANTAIGFESLKTEDTGDGNTAVGYKALKFCNGEDDNGNTAIGYLALPDLSSGKKNVAIGFKAGLTFNGDNSTIIGYEAGLDADGNATSASNSTLIGMEAGKHLDDGTFNTAIGIEAMKSNSGGGNAAIGNTCIGWRSGDLIEDGQYNVIIGHGAEVSTADGINQIAIGKETQGQGNNSVTLGNGDVTDVYMAQDSGAVVHASGLKFDSDQTNNIDEANTLDDYEEGEYTVTMTPSTSGTITVNPSQDQGNYTKVGNVVHVNFKVDISSVSSPDGFFTIGLPFTIGDGTHESKRFTGSVAITGSTANVSDFVLIGIEGEGGARVYLGDGTAFADDSADALQNGNDLYLSVTYQV